MTNEHDNDKQVDLDANRDPLTGEPGAHPIGTGIGAGTAGVIGTAIGATVGPVGAAVGAVVGSVVGGLVGKGTAEVFDPTLEGTYWRDNYTSRPYVNKDLTYEDYDPAYRTGYEGYSQYGGDRRPYEEVEPELRHHYETNHPNSRLRWEEAKHATQDAWNRLKDNFTAHDEDDYWHRNYAFQPYYETGIPYERYQPAYRMGYEGYHQYPGRTFDEAEPELRRNYERDYGSSGLGWEKAKQAARDAWHRVEQAFGRR